MDKLTIKQDLFNEKGWRIPEEKYKTFSSNP